MTSRNRRPFKAIRGFGGEPDPPQAHVPTESPDSLRSQAFLRVMDLISEGEIVGLVAGDKSVYLDQTPLQSPDGTYNFSGVTYDGRTGTQDQLYIAGFNDVDNEIEINVEVRAEVPVVRQITNPNVNRARVRIALPALTTTSSGSGDITGAAVQLAIDVQSAGGSYVQQYIRDVSGKASSRYEFEVDVALPGSAPWNIRVRRPTPNSNSSLVTNKTYVAAITEIIDGKMRYPNSALIGMRLDSQQFQNVPSRAYDIKGIKVQIPANYNPTTRAYTGSWNGTFSVAWTDNPAWIFYDLLTNERYGLGGFLDASQVDKWALYAIAQYCDEIIPNGFGGTEPRFTCNLCISSPEEAFKVLQNMASVFRGMIYWGAGTVTVTQDAPQDPVALFSRANVENGVFTYQGAASKARHSVALVSWNDPADFYKQKVEYVEDQAAIAKFGIQQTDIVAFGCTSQGQAHRLGKWLLYTEQHESESVTFVTGLDGLVARPGQIINVQDPARAGARMAGRLNSATTTSATIDGDLPGALSGWEFSCLLPSGAIGKSVVVGNTGRVLALQPALAETPAAEAIWMLTSPDLEPQTFRVIGIKEEGNGRYTVNAIAHDPDKFAEVELGLNIAPKNYSLLRVAPDTPTGLIITESLYQTATEVKSKATISWNRVDFAVSYILRYKFENNNYVELPESQFADQEILDTQPGTYVIQVCAINALGKRSVAAQISQSLLGKTAPPANVQSFSLIPNQGHALLTWTQAGDLDVLVGGQIRIRWTPLLVGQKWSDAIDIVPAIPGTATSAIAPLLAGTYMAKFVDSSGVYSVSESLIETTVPESLALNVVTVQEEDPGFTGVKTGMIVDSVNHALCLASTELVDDYILVDSIGDWDFPGLIVAAGQYDFSTTIDLSGVWPTNITSLVQLQAYNLGNVWDARLSPMDGWDDIDGGAITDVDATLYVRTTNDNPAGTPTWTDWKRIHAGSYAARAFQFRLICTSGSPDHNLRIKQLQVTLDLDDRVVEQSGLVSGVGTTYRVNYAEPFYAEPAVSITANALSSGDYFTISNSSATGFDVVFKNAGGSTVSRTFNFIAKGYGRKVA